MTEFLKGVGMPENKRVVYFNGKIVPEAEAKVSIYDSALMFGDMVFEMTRSFNKQHFKLREHLERLYAGLKYFQIPLNMTIDQMEEACYLATEKNEKFFMPEDEHRLMINVSRGLLGLYAGYVDHEPGPNVIIADFPLRWTIQAAANLYTNGIEVVIPNQRNIPSQLLDPKIKNRSRVHYMMANMQVSGYGGKNVWALLLDTDGFVTEGTGANFFLVKDGVILTPEPRNILRGISRSYVFELADQLGYTCIEKNIELYDVIHADEAFFTSTPFCMLPVVKCQGLKIGHGVPGEIYHQIIAQWSRNVGVDIIAQVKQYASFEKANQYSNSPTPYEFRN